MSALKAWALILGLALVGLVAWGAADVAWDRVRMVRRLQPLPVPRGCGRESCPKPGCPGGAR